MGRRKEALLALAILSIVSTLCIRGMQAVGDRIAARQER
jgi:type II secretory pathway component PulJ